MSYSLSLMGRTYSLLKSKLIIEEDLYLEWLNHHAEYFCENVDVIVCIFWVIRDSYADYAFGGD